MSDLTDAIDAICRRLTAEPAAVARELGAVVEEQTSALQVRPYDERFSDAYVVHDGGDVSHIDLTLREPASLDELGQDFREAPRMPNRPRQLHFDAEGCTIIASVEDERVRAVTVRRD